MYNEKRISVEAGEGEKTEYRVWNPFRSKLAASVLAGVDNIHIKPGGKVLYLGAASGTSVSHVSDIVGPTGAVFAVEFSHRSGEPPTSRPSRMCCCFGGASGTDVPFLRMLEHQRRMYLCLPCCTAPLVMMSSLLGCLFWKAGHQQDLMLLFLRFRYNE